MKKYVICTRATGCGLECPHKTPHERGVYCRATICSEPADGEVDCIPIDTEQQQHIANTIQKLLELQGRVDGYASRLLCEALNELDAALGDSDAD